MKKINRLIKINYKSTFNITNYIFHNLQTSCADRIRKQFIFYSRKYIKRDFVPYNLREL